MLNARGRRALNNDNNNECEDGSIAVSNPCTRIGEWLSSP